MLTELKTTPPPPGRPIGWQSFHLLPIITCEKGKSINCWQLQLTKNKAIYDKKERPPPVQSPCILPGHLLPVPLHLLLPLHGRLLRFALELPPVGSCHTVHHHLIALSMEKRSKGSTCWHLPTFYPAVFPSLSNVTGPSLQVQVRVQSERLPHWGSGLSIHLNGRLWYSSMVITQPIWFGQVPSRSPSGSIYRFI